MGSLDGGKKNARSMAGVLERSGHQLSPSGSVTTTAKQGEEAEAAEKRDARFGNH